MNNEWTLREEIYRFAHKWPLIVIFFMIGALIGYGITLLLPTPYRAEASLHVSFNGDVYPRNPDDYKNWHMQELEVLITSDQVIQETLNRLRSQDAYWNTVDTQGVIENLNVYWRNTGEWRLVAESQTPERASNLVETWQQVIVETVGAASTHAQNMLTLNAQIGSTAAAQVDTGLMVAELTALQEALLAWKETALQTGPSAPLSTLDRWSLLALVSGSAGLDAAGHTLLEKTPAYDTPAKDYIVWIDQALMLLEQELIILETQAEALDYQQEDLQQALTTELEASLGVSAYLTVEPLPPDISGSYAVRPISQAALIGGMIGLLLWMLIWLALPHGKTNS